MFALPPDRPAIMGVLNVTPDSFSDGGQFLDPGAAVGHGLKLVEEGADLVDVGGESTRPGAEPVSADEELARVLPVVQELARSGVPVSIDTSKAAVARTCLAAGAVVVNDVTALGDPDMAGVCAIAECFVCLMHMKGEPRTMQDSPSYGDVVTDVLAYLVDRADRAASAGVTRGRVWIDPGIGFGKTVEHNLALIRDLGRFVETGYPVLIGVSRKSFIGKVLGGLPADQRLEGTIAAQVLAQCNGARIIRTHDVLAAKRASEMARAILA